MVSTKKSRRHQRFQSVRVTQDGTARRNYRTAVRATQELQEEAGQWWRAAIGAADGQKRLARFSEMARSTVPLTQRNVERWVNFINTSSRTNTEWLSKAVDAIQRPHTAETQAWMDLWTSSLKAAQSNLDAVAEFSAHAIESWKTYVRKNIELTPQRAA